MHHFRSKDVLIEAVMAYFGDQVERMLLRKVATDPNPNWRWARAMLSSALPDPNLPPQNDVPLTDGVIERFMLATLAGAVNNPGLFAPLRVFGKQLQQRLLSDSPDGLDQLLIWLMVDGLFLWQFLGLIQRDDPLYTQIGDVLRARVAGHQTRITPPKKPATSDGGELS